jgi:hypothetical protein
MLLVYIRVSLAEYLRTQRARLSGFAGVARPSVACGLVPTTTLIRCDKGFENVN